MGDMGVLIFMGMFLLFVLILVALFMWWDLH